MLHCSASGFEFENILLILKVMFLALTEHQSTLTVKILSKLYKLYKQGLVQAGLREVLNSKIFSPFLSKQVSPDILDVIEISHEYDKWSWPLCIFKTFAQGVFIWQVDLFWNCRASELSFWATMICSILFLWWNHISDLRIIGLSWDVIIPIQGYCTMPSRKWGCKNSLISRANISPNISCANIFFQILPLQIFPV